MSKPVAGKFTFWATSLHKNVQFDFFCRHTADNRLYWTLEQHVREARRRRPTNDYSLKNTFSASQTSNTQIWMVGTPGISDHLGVTGFLMWYTLPQAQLQCCPLAIHSRKHLSIWATWPLQTSSTSWEWGMTHWRTWVSLWILPTWWGMQVHVLGKKVRCSTMKRMRVTSKI